MRGRDGITADGAARRRLRAALLRWYGAHRRDLPWRRSHDPYRIWVSEVMLQQTRVEVVLPAYRRFLRAFPTMARLARAAEDDVLSLWSGLGYYTRARALHRAARLVHESGETFPRRIDDARELPGVGAYTAAAVLSIAYGAPHAAVDGNIARVLSRLKRLPRPDSRGEPHQSLAQELLDASRPGDWNQAMMELGQTLCLPKSPRCGDCPVSRWCQARLHGEVDRYPVPKPRRRLERVALDLTVVRDDQGRLLLEKGAFPHLDHLWLPIVGRADVGRAVPGPPRTSDVGRAVPAPPRPPQQKRTRRGEDAPPYIGPPRPRQQNRTRQAEDGPPYTFRHAILHRAFQVKVAARTAGDAEIRRLLRAASGGERRLFTPEEIRAIGRSSLLTKALAHVARQHP